MNNVAQNDEKSIIGAIKIDKKEVQEHLNTLVKESVEEVLNKLLNAEADATCNASRYERSPDRLDTRAGTYKRKLLTKAGEVELQVPRLRTLPFETQIIERYRRKWDDGIWFIRVVHSRRQSYVVHVSKQFFSLDDFDSSTATIRQ